MSLPTQAKILRVLQEGEFERLGGNAADPGSTSASSPRTNRDLDAAIARADASARTCSTASTSSRSAAAAARARGRSDAAGRALPSHRASAVGRAAPVLTEAASAKLAKHPWPGNIRELQNVIRRAVLVCRGDRITPSDLEFGATAIAGAASRPAASAVGESPDQAVELARKLAGWAMDGGHTNLYSMLHDILETAEFCGRRWSASGGTRPRSPSGWAWPETP